MDGQCLRNYFLVVLNGLKKHPNLNQNIIIYYNEDSDKEYFLEVDVQYPEELHELHNDCHFSKKSENWKG